MPFDQSCLNREKREILDDILEFYIEYKNNKSDETEYRLKQAFARAVLADFSNEAIQSEPIWLERNASLQDKALEITCNSARRFVQPLLAEAALYDAYRMTDLAWKEIKQRWLLVTPALLSNVERAMVRANKDRPKNVLVALYFPRDSLPPWFKHAFERLVVLFHENGRLEDELVSAIDHFQYGGKEFTEEYEEAHRKLNTNVQEALSMLKVVMTFFLAFPNEKNRKNPAFGIIESFFRETSRLDANDMINLCLMLQLFVCTDRVIIRHDLTHLAKRERQEDNSLADTSDDGVLSMFVPWVPAKGMLPTLKFALKIADVPSHATTSWKYELHFWEWLRQLVNQLVSMRVSFKSDQCLFDELEQIVWSMNASAGSHVVYNMVVNSLSSWKERLTRVPKRKRKGTNDATTRKHGRGKAHNNESERETSVPTAQKKKIVDDHANETDGERNEERGDDGGNMQIARITTTCSGDDTRTATVTNYESSDL